MPRADRVVQRRPSPSVHWRDLDAGLDDQKEEGLDAPLARGKVHRRAFVVIARGEVRARVRRTPQPFHVACSCSAPHTAVASRLFESVRGTPRPGELFSCSCATSARRRSFSELTAWEAMAERQAPMFKRRSRGRALFAVPDELGGFLHVLPLKPWALGVEDLCCNCN